MSEPRGSEVTRPFGMRVHNHGPEEGGGYACREWVIDGRFIVGDCLLPAALLAGTTAPRHAEEVKCTRCGRWHSGMAPDDSETDVCENCARANADADWLEENALGFWAEGHPVSCQCRKRLVAIAKSLRAREAAVRAEGSSERDWPDIGENAGYQNKCIECRQIFLGHKRRMICCQCAAKSPARAPDVTESDVHYAIIAYRTGKQDADDEIEEPHHAGICAALESFATRLAGRTAAKEKP